MAETATPKKRVVRKKTAKKTQARKAPTRKPTSTTRNGLPSSAKFTIALFVAFGVTSGVSYAIGVSDKGVIDVRGIINERATAEEAKGNTAESQALRNIGQQEGNQGTSNGGLVGAGNQETRQQDLKREQEQANAQQNASSTDETASSTDAVASSTEAIGEESEAVGEETLAADEEVSEDVPEDTEQDTE